MISATANTAPIGPAKYRRPVPPTMLATGAQRLGTIRATRTIPVTGPNETRLLP